MDAAEGRAMVLHRSLGMCEVQCVPNCRASQPEWHHRQLRRSRRHGPENGIAACRPCHAWIHLHPTEALTNGWMVSQAREPSQVPAVLRRHGTHPPEPVLLSAGGTYT